MSLSRRDFARLAAPGVLLPLTLQAGKQRPVRVAVPRPPDFLPALAARELLRGLTRLHRGADVRMTDAPVPGELVISLRVGADGLSGPEAYVIESVTPGLVLRGASARALVYAVHDFLERQGAFFGIDGESYPLDEPPQLFLPPAGQPWAASPRFSVRGLLPWPDFLNCITVYNEEDFRAYFESMLRMRFNTFGMHVYTGGAQWAESYLSYQFAGAGHLSFLDNSATHRWGYLPQRTSTFGMGAAQFYDSETFGSDATRLGRDNWEIADRTRALLRNSLSYARRLGLRTGVGFEPYQIPDEILRALPPEIRPEEIPGRKSAGPRFDIESFTAQKMLETRLGQLLEAYPDVDHVWLWEDEDMNWSSRRTGAPLSVTPFLQAHEFLRRNAPTKRLVLGGWGGVARNFEYFHRKLPGDVVFSALSDSLGWDPIHEVFGKLEGRERWPIPWLEDDPGMWLPQFHVHRFRRDLDLAAKYGCQGMIGIHWRHRIVDPTAAFMARYSWDGELAPADHYKAYARTQATAVRAPRLAAALNGTDQNHTILSTGTPEIKDGHVVTREYSGDYTEGFTFWSDHEPEPSLTASQLSIAQELRALANAGATGFEDEKLGYLAGHLEWLTHYTDAWTTAHRLQVILKQAAALKKQGQAAEAKALIAGEGVAMYLRIPPDVHDAMIHFQEIVATRNDLGTLASMQNKFVRLALHRLPLSLAEYLGEMPPAVEKAVAAALQPDPDEKPRLIVPTRPTLLGPGERVRVMAIATGPQAPATVTLHIRPRGAAAFTPLAMRLMGRRTYEANLGPFTGAAPIAEYYVSARFAGAPVTAPREAPANTYCVTLTEKGSA